MTKFIKRGDTIHALGTNINTRKLTWKGLKKNNPYTKERLMRYECDRNSYAEIVKMCSEKDLQMKGTEKFHHNIGDCLEADGISVYIRTLRKLKEEVKEGVSARHGATIINIRYYAISSISKPLKVLEKCINKGLLEQNSQK